jgi:uncharacterized protein
MSHCPTPHVRRLLASMFLPMVMLMGAAQALAAGNVVISQVYGGGGNSGATLKNDFIELYNRSGAAVDIGGWSVQYASATGTTWQVTSIPAGTSLPSGRYFLVRQAFGAGGSVDINADVTGTIAMSGSSGKVALASDATALAGANPASGAVVDRVGYGTANGFEGSGAAPGLTNTTAAFRAGGGATDTDNNAADFSVGTPAPRYTGGDAVIDGAGGSPIDLAIFEIQGSSAQSTYVGQAVRTIGVVTHRTSNGFFMQDVAGDGNTATSDGLFVFTGSTAFAAVAVGNLVQVTGGVVEFSNGAGTAATPLTQIANPTAVTLSGSGQVPSPVPLSLPLAAGDSFERFEGMLVNITSPMTVQQNFFQGRYGQITIGAGGRHETPTNRFRPGASAQALADQQARGRLLLDDSSSVQNPNPIPYLAYDSGVPRAGDTVTSLTGVIDFGLATNNSAGAGLYRLQPTVAPSFVASNPRPAAPPAVGGNIRVGSMNVLNYFTTFTNGNNVFGQSGQGCALDGNTSASNCRGASNLAEFNRQRAKIVLALTGLNADVVGLMEIQNNGAVAAQNLVDGLNAVLGAGTYAVVPDPPAGTGSDAIKVAMIFKPAKLSRVGNAASDTDPVNDRPTLAQTFAAANGERFTVVVNHFKSKSCGDASGADADQGDGQGCFNAVRLQQAQRLRSFVDTQQVASGSNDVVVIGDLNAYGQEDPIFELTSNGFVDQLLRFNAPAYSYIFDGASGRLDHGITTAALSPKVAGTVAWHINADEASVRDYNQEFKAPATNCSGPCPNDPFDSTTPARSSDHDPVLLGLNIYKNITGTAARNVLMGSPGDDRITGGPGADLLTGGGGANLFVYNSVLDAGDTVTDFKPGADKLVLTDLLRSIGRSALVNPVASGHVTCVSARGGALIGIDTDGSAGGLPSRGLALLQRQNCASVMNAQNFVF